MKSSEYEAIKAVCDKWYPAKKAEHCASVEAIVMQDPMFLALSEEHKYFVRALAYAHDLFEDTACPPEELIVCIDIDGEFERVDFLRDLTLLTHDKDADSYYDYVREIVNSRRCFAVMVKRADMVDHLQRKATLTDKLKKKYAPVIPMLFYPREVLR
jgi:hypothetical protein